MAATPTFQRPKHALAKPIFNTVVQKQKQPSFVVIGLRGGSLAFDDTSLPTTPTTSTSTSPLEQQHASPFLLGTKRTPATNDNKADIIDHQDVDDDPYSMHPNEQARYHQNLSPQYATHDGYVYGAQAVDLFSKSGLEKELLRDIWNLTPRAVENRLSRVEFGIAMNLVVCVSTKGLEVPRVLPVSLTDLVVEEREQVASSSRQHTTLSQNTTLHHHPPPRPYSIALCSMVGGTSESLDKFFQTTRQKHPRVYLPPTSPQHRVHYHNFLA